jgi:hypothetical protein
MANRYSGKFIVVDTTDTQLGGSSPTGGVKGDLYIKAIKWVATAAKAIADANKLTIEWKDTNGDIVIACDAQLAALTGSVIYSVEFGGKPWVVPGLYIEDLDGGEIQIFLD